MIKKVYPELYRRGFTLIELLVVIFIIGVLASIVVVNVNRARQDSRDARRRADLATLKTANELYYDMNKSYAPNKNELVTKGFLSIQPVDPIGDSTYFYDYRTNGTAYCFYANLEQPTLSGAWDNKGMTPTGPVSSAVTGMNYAIGSCNF